VVRGRESPHFESLCCLDEAGKLGLRHRGLALVHEVNDALHLPSSDVLEHDDGVLARVVDEYLLEVWAEREEEI
jgi:hypothetical protein